MPVEETTKLKIKCDNPNCPDSSGAAQGLDPEIRDGWIFISGEVYGQPSASYVFCSTDCISAGAATAPGFTKAEAPEVLAAPE
jgi:hypothetical protein